MLDKPSNPFLFTNMAGKRRTKHYVIRSVLHGLIPCCMFHLLLPLFPGILSSWTFKENGIFQRVILAIATGPSFCALTSCLIKLDFNSLIQDTGCHLMSLEGLGKREKRKVPWVKVLCACWWLWLGIIFKIQYVATGKTQALTKGRGHQEVFVLDQGLETIQILMV